MKYTPLLTASFLVALFSLTGSCKKDNDNNQTTVPLPIDTTGIPAPFKKIYGASQIYVQGDYIVIIANGVPDHKSPYFFNTQWASTKYEAYNGTNSSWAQNPNSIGAQNYTFMIPKSPTIPTTKTQTPMGPMGIALNGVPIFNQYAAGRVALTSEINSFDQYNGHPAMGSDYHYHMEPLYLTTLKGKDALIGFLLDGFPVYGPVENGTTLNSSSLDAYHGHTGATSDYPAGIYHYHITADAPYINGDGFWGTPGSVTK